MKKNPLFNRITIVGVGLLGGSLGLAAKKFNIAGEVVGYLRDPKKILPAIKAGAIDSGTTDLRRAIEGSDLIILCTPVNDIIKKLRLFTSWRVKALITDTGSTKVRITREAKDLCFTGSHPIAGSEQSGISFARSDLFKNSLCILTPQGHQASNARRIAAFWKKTGSRVRIMTPQQHDKMLSFTSHLPHAIAFCLMNTIAKDQLAFASGGLKDTTRIASSRPELWVDVFTSNKTELLKAIASFETTLRRFRQDLLCHPGALHHALAAARKKRNRWTHTA